MNTLIKTYFSRGIFSKHERPRRGFILKIILLGNIALITFGTIYASRLEQMQGMIRDGIDTDILYLALSYFIFLYVLYKRGHLKTASLLLIGFYYAAVTHCVSRWGISLPSNILGYTLIITISSILLGNTFGFAMTGIIFVTMLFAGYKESVLGITHEWENYPIKMSDVIFYSIMLVIIMFVSWLSNRETERSLFRAEQSEKELQKERDMLEITVENRTEALKQAQAERVSQLYHFAEFGKISSGLFHDLVNPLFTVSLNINDLENSLHSELPEIKANLDRSLRASQKMERFIHAIRRHIRIDTLKELFLINSIIEDVLLLLNYKALKAQVTLEYNPQESISIYQNPLEFQQIISNIVSNAIDSYDGADVAKKDRVVRIQSNLKDSMIRISITDNGMGIPASVQEKIYNPFFSTKDASKGMGLGLSTTKRIIEKNFNGTILLESISGIGTHFIITFPCIIPPSSPH